MKESVSFAAAGMEDQEELIQRFEVFEMMMEDRLDTDVELFALEEVI